MYVTVLCHLYLLCLILLLDLTILTSYPPELRDLVYICDKTYKRKEIIHMEYNILKSLEYQITIPTAHTLFVQYLKVVHADRSIVQISCYNLVGTLQSYSLLQYLPSQLDSAAVMIARQTIPQNPSSLF